MTASRKSTRAAPPPRVIIENVQPTVDAGRWPACRVVGDVVTVEADVFADGHDRLAGRVVFRHADEDDWREATLTLVVNDRWRAEFPVDRLGRYEFAVRAWVDRFASWRDGLAKKVAAGLDVASELLEGAALVEEHAGRARGAQRKTLRAVAQRLAGEGPQDERIAAALDDALVEQMAAVPPTAASTSRSEAYPLTVQRERARFSAWYELFPRSCGERPGEHGTLRDCTRRLDYVAGLGFDVVYLPPIHPIGTTHRKGPNNNPRCGPGDPGSPWAIGAAAGGHTAVHPELGTLDDFDALVARAETLGVEVALDIAFQCAPDHPWVREHPEWFRQRPDGSIQYAENPPKKYQDIYPLDFDGPDWRGLWDALEGVFRFWMEHGVRIFRVDNPHTKSLRFWTWVMERIQATDPDVIFLSEAFTRPRVLEYLAKCGFTQSYTYFTWRNTKWELTEYLTELTQTSVREYLRPNFFANTPDILHEYLQVGGRPAFQARLILAATLSSSYGIYGPPFELCIGDAIPGTEEYRDSEKYQVRHWDLAAPHSLRDLVTRVNDIRRTNPALQTTSGLRFCAVDNEQLLCFAKQSADDGNTVLVVVNLDPHYVQSGWIDLPLDALGLPHDQPFQVHDLLSDARYMWSGARNFVSLDPHAIPAHVFRVRRRVGTEQDFDYYA